MGRYALLEEWGGKTVIYHPNERVKRMIELAGLERIIAVEYPQTANRKMVDKHEN